MSKKSTKEVQQVTEGQTISKFERFERGTQEAEHHLFKLKVAAMKKNMSWIYRAPQVVELEHSHFYHSINDTTLSPNKFCSPVGGHFHEVKLVTNPETGEIISAKCGPAVTYVTRKIAGGRSIKRIERVKWERYNEAPQDNQIEGDEFAEYEPTPSGEAQVLTEFDDHVHELEYLGFEKFTTQSKVERRKEETAKVRGLMGGQVSRQPGAMQALEQGPKSDVARRVLTEGAESTKG